MEDYDIIITAMPNIYDDNLFLLTNRRIKIMHPKIKVPIGIFKSVFFDYRMSYYKPNIKNNYFEESLEGRFNIWKLIVNGASRDYFLDIANDVKIKILSDNPNDFGKKDFYDYNFVM